jgi:hypothetical protein
VKSPKYNVGDLVEITNTKTKFKAHPNLMDGKLAIITKTPRFYDPSTPRLLIYFVYVEGFVFSVMEDHLKKPEQREKIKTYNEYTD